MVNSYTFHEYKMFDFFQDLQKQYEKTLQGSSMILTGLQEFSIASNLVWPDFMCLLGTRLCNGV